MATPGQRVTDTSRMNFEAGSWQEAAYEMYVGCHVGADHAVYFAKLFFQEYLNKPVSKALGMKVSEQRGSSVSNGQEGLKVVGVGYGRTGTVSLRCKDASLSG